jgi:hypothetical protein
MAEQVAFGTNDFAENPEPRCPCILLLDTSGSMGGQPIAQLNEGLVAYGTELAGDALFLRADTNPEATRCRVSRGTVLRRLKPTG